MSTGQDNGAYSSEKEYSGHPYARLEDDSPSQPAGSAYSSQPAGSAYPLQPPQGTYPIQTAGSVYPSAPPPYYAQPSQTTVVVQQAQARPESYLVLSCLVYWCCNWIFGGIGFGLAMASSSAADENDMEQARKLGRASMWVNVAGIVCTVVTAIIIVIIYFAVGAASVYSYY